MTTKAQRRRRDERRRAIRDVFFGVVGTLILLHEVLQVSSPRPLLIFTALFLYGLIPAFRADERASSGPGPFGRLILAMLGITLPDPEEKTPEQKGRA